MLFKRTDIQRTWKLDTFPNALVIHSRKFHLVNWVPTKLDIQVNGVEKVDVTQMKSQGRQEGDVDLPDSNDDKGMQDFQWNNSLTQSRR